jgi:ssDNA-specific exonuclease RecJ
VLLVLKVKKEIREMQVYKDRNEKLVQQELLVLSDLREM